MSRPSIADFSFSFVLTDPRQYDNPIVYASSAFLNLTGYGMREVLGQNCRFLQGPKTERRHIMELRNAMREERPCNVCFLNYKKSGEKFWNQLYIEPIRDTAGLVTRYVGVLTDVTRAINSRPPQLSKIRNISNSPTHSDPIKATTPIPLIEGWMKDIIEGEVREAGEVAQWVSKEGQMTSSGLRGACSVLPSRFLGVLCGIQQSFVLIDPRLPNMPIVHASDGFLKLTGYPKEMVIGRNCRFLQGDGTDATEVAKIREAVHATPPRTVTVTLLNYRYDGSPFWNALHISPVRGADGRVAYLVGVQLDVSDETCDYADLPSAVTAQGSINNGVNSQPYAGRFSFCGDPQLKQLLLHSGTVGEVRVAVRSLSGSNGGLHRSIE